MCDPRPGCEEVHPSFSIFVGADGKWRWKRHGGDGAGGDAYDLLIALGHQPGQAMRLLRQHVGAALPVAHRSVAARPAQDPLTVAQQQASGCHPMSETDEVRIRRHFTAVQPGSPAALDLKRRGLWQWPDINVGQLKQPWITREGRLQAHAGALGLWIPGPDGATHTCKIRNLGSAAELAGCQLERYLYAVRGYGAPAWCSAGYGRGGALLMVEGEYNGAAATRALRQRGCDYDVQGLAGADGPIHWPSGLLGRVVYVAADDDRAGAGCVARVAAIAQAAGAAGVRVVTPPPDGEDYCDLAGRLGLDGLGDWLLTRLQDAPQWVPVGL
jgi:hypothetical protein